MTFLLNFKKKKNFFIKKDKKNLNLFLFLFTLTLFPLTSPPAPFILTDSDKLFFGKKKKKRNIYLFYHLFLFIFYTGLWSNDNEINLSLEQRMLLQSPTLIEIRYSPKITTILAADPTF
jgi:hypothetical protein